MASDDGRIPAEHEKKEKQAPMYGSIYTKTWDNGTRIEISNDDKNPYIDFYTHAGNKMTVRPDGSLLLVTTGDRNEYDMCGITSTNDHNRDNKGHGVSRTQDATKEEEVTGKDGMAAGSDIAFVVMGKANIRAESAYIGTDKDLNINCGGNCDMKVKGNFTETVGGDMTTTVAGTRHTKASKIKHN